MSTLVWILKMLNWMGGYALVEDQEALQDLQFMLVGHALSNLVVQLCVRKRLLGLETLV